MTIVGFAGMTHLGLNTAVATAAHGFDVIGYDPDPAVVGRLQVFELPVVEPGLDSLIEDNKARLTFTADPRSLSACDVVYIAADVPTDDDAKSDLSPIRALTDTVAANLNDHAVLVILCQVPPGFTRTITSVPPDRLVYQVETLIFGRAVERAMYPERFIIGLADPSVGLPPALLQVLQSFDCPILPMRFESAELAKISINFCLVASVSVANTLAEVSEAIGADWSEIVPALKLDRRIGQFAYLTPGLGISGGNLERDLRTVIDVAETGKADVGIVKAWIANSQWRKDWPWRTLKATVLDANPGARIAVLGLAYKENTHSTKNSPALVLLGHLTGHDVAVHDPVVPASVVPWARGCAAPLDALDGADVLVVVTPWPEYRSIQPDQIEQAMRGRTVIDPYGMLDRIELVKRGFSVHTLGRQ